MDDEWAELGCAAVKERKERGERYLHLLLSINGFVQSGRSDETRLLAAFGLWPHWALKFSRLGGYAYKSVLWVCTALSLDPGPA